MARTVQANLTTICRETKMRIKVWSHCLGKVLAFLAAVLLVATPPALAIDPSTANNATFYVGMNGNDDNPGTKEQPLRTLGRAAEIVNSSTDSGPTCIKVAPGIYNLTESVVFENERPYTEKDRLVIEADILPDDPRWDPALMPVILSTRDPRQPGNLSGLTATYSMEIKISHVTIRGLKFLGNPLQNNWHCCVSRAGNDLEDLVVTQCLFVGDRDALNIYCPVLADGDGFVVDHCIFYKCTASAVFWDGLEGRVGRRNAMRYCIVDGGLISGVWTCKTADDFEFHHNIVTRCEFFWIRKAGEPLTEYRLHGCVVTDNKHFSGYGVESGPTGETGPEITYREEDVIKAGHVLLEKDKRKRDYLHVVEGTLGSGLGAGLFKTAGK